MLKVVPDQQVDLDRQDQRVLKEPQVLKVQQDRLEQPVHKWVIIWEEVVMLPVISLKLFMCGRMMHHRTFLLLNI